MKEEKSRETLGQRLKKIREDRGLSLEEVSRRTKIHIKVLNAVEQDQIESSATPFYARSFVKSYAQLLGIEDDELVRQFLSAAKKPARQVLFLEGQKEKELSEVFKILKIVFIVALSVIFLLFAFSVLKSFSKKLKAIKPKAVSSKVVKPQKVIKKEGQRVKEGLNLMISAKEDTWLQLKADGRVIFKGVLAKGKKESWNAKNKLELWTGNAGAIELRFNGKDLGSPGKKGEIMKNITFTRGGMKAR